jgi:hypothetical protein
MSASRGLWLLLGRECRPSGAANAAKEPDMATTKQIARRRMIAALAISGRPGATDGKPPRPRRRRRRSAQLVWRCRPPVASRPAPEPRERGSCSAASSSTTIGRLRGIAHRRPGRARHARRPSDDPTVSRRRTQPASSGRRSASPPGSTFRRAASGAHHRIAREGHYLLRPRGPRGPRTPRRRPSPSRRRRAIRSNGERSETPVRRPSPSRRAPVQRSIGQKFTVQRHQRAAALSPSANAFAIEGAVD